MKKFRKLILGAVTAAAAAVMSLCAVPDEVLPGLAVTASAAYVEGGTENSPCILANYNEYVTLSGGVYSLNSDIVVTDSLRVCGDVTIKLNGNTLTANKIYYISGSLVVDGHGTENNGTIKIVGTNTGSGGITGNVSISNATIDVSADSTYSLYCDPLSLTNVTFTNSCNTIQATNFTSISIINCTNVPGISLAGSNADSVSNVTNSEINGNLSCSFTKNNINISGSKITGNITCSDEKNAENVLTISGNSSVTGKITGRKHCVITDSTLSGCTISNAAITDSTIQNNSTVTGSTVTRGTITGSTVSTSTIDSDTEIKSSTVTNSTVGSKQVTNDTYDENGDIIGVTVNVSGDGTVSFGSKSASDTGSFTIPANKSDVITLTLTPNSGKVVKSVEYGYTNSNDVSITGRKFPVSGNTATLTVPADLKDGTSVNLTVTFVSALAGGADETSAVALTNNAVTDLAGGWYKVDDSDIDFNHTLNLLGDTHLIIAEDKTMTVNTSSGNGIDSDHTLTVSGSGALNVETTEYGKIAVRVGSYVQTGATVTASGYIGIRCMDDFVDSDIPNNFSFSGGKLTSTGSSDGVWVDNNITIDYTNADDFIKSSSYEVGYDIDSGEYGTVTIADGKYFIDEGGIIYSGEQTLYVDTAKDLANKKLVPAYEVKFDMNYDGGEDIIKGVPASTGKVTKPADPTREGYTFKGWYDNEACTGDPFNFENTTITGDTTLYAKWLQHITYINAAGDSATVTDYTPVTSSDTAVTWTAGTYVVADNVEIKGNDDNSPIKANGNINLILCDGKKLTITMTNNGDAGIKAINYDLTIYGQSVGSGELSIASARPSHYGRGIQANNLNFYGGKLSCECTSVGTQNSDYLVPVDANSIIFGWTSPNNSIYIKHIPTSVDTISLSNVPTFVKPYIVQDTNTLVTGSDVDDITKLINGKTLVPAYKVTFDANGGYFGDDTTKTTFDKGAAATGTAKITAPTAPTRDESVEEHYFAGWYTDSGCADGTKFDFSAAITDDITLYAKWVAHRHTLTHYPASSGNCRTRGNIEYWHCSGCEKNFSDSEGNTEITGSVTTDYGSHSYSSKITTPATCTTAGIRTHTCSICGNSYTSTINALRHDYDPETGKCSRCGQYDPEKYLTVTFDTDGGTDIGTQPVIPGEKAVKPADPEKTGYTFKGWYVGSTEYDFDTELTENITITAKWEINSYTVTFVTGCETALDPVEVEYNKTVAMPDGLAKEGHTFVEWQLGGTAYDFASPVTGNITLTAKWKAEEYTVTFVLDGNAYSTAKVEFGKTVAFPEISVPADKKLFGWYTDEAMKTLYNATTPVKADITLYAAEKQKADVYIGGEPATGTFTDNLKNIKGDNVVITLGEDVEIGKLTFPKAKDAAEIVIDGGGCTIEFTGSAAIKPNQKLTLVNVNIEALKDNKPQNITITAANGGLTLENVTLNGKKATVTASAGDLILGNVSGNELNVKGAAKTTLTANEDIAAATVTGFGTVNVNGTLNVTKTLTVNELTFADSAVLKVAGGAAVTVKKRISGNGTIDLASGFKPVSISGEVNGNITLTGDKMTDGTQIFKTKLDLSGNVDISGIAPEVTDGGEYKYGLYAKSGKVYLRAFRMQVGNTTYCEWTDIMNAITKAKASGKIYAIELLGDIDLGKTFKLPTKGKYAGLTIDGNKHTITFSGSSITLTGDLTLTDLTLSATAIKGCTIKPGKFTLDADDAKLVNCIVK